MVMTLNIIIITALKLLLLHALLGNCLLITQNRRFGKRNTALYRTTQNSDNPILGIENYLLQLKIKSGMIKLYIINDYFKTIITIIECKKQLF